MAQETKVGLLVGLALILLVGLVLSDLFTSGPTPADAADAPTGFGREAQAGIYSETPPHANPDVAARRPRSDDAMFQAEPAPAYRAPPRETATPMEPAPSRRGSSPELPELDTLEAQNNNAALVRHSLEAMRLMPSLPENSPAVNIERDVLADAARTQRTPSDTAAARTANPRHTTPTTPTRGTVFFHQVQAGQTLTDIARQHYGSPEFARAIALSNPTKLDREGRVRAGTRLEIPPLGSSVFREIFKPVSSQHAAAVNHGLPALPGRAPRGSTSTQRQGHAGMVEILVQPGDTLSELAAEHLGSAGHWGKLLAANSDQMDTASDLRSGMKLRLPRIASAPAPRVERAPPLATSTTPAARATTAASRPNTRSQAASPYTYTYTYTVETGDNLSRIAAKLLGDSERWDELLAANADQLDKPEHLRAGMVLKLPQAAQRPAAAPATTARPEAAAPAAVATTTPANTKTYTVQAGDNLTRIARDQLGDGDRWYELYEANTDQLSSPDALAAGQTLRLP